MLPRQSHSRVVWQIFIGLLYYLKFRNLLAVQWLGLGVSLAGAQVQSLVREVRSLPHATAKTNKQTNKTFLNLVPAHGKSLNCFEGISKQGNSSFLFFGPTL